MDITAMILASLVAGAAFIFGHKSGQKAGATAVHRMMANAVIQYAFRNPGISESRITELADSLVKSDGDMHEQAVEHIRKAAQEAVGLEGEAP